MSFEIAPIISRLRINAVNDAFSIGGHAGSAAGAHVKDIISPVDGQKIASVKMAGVADYEQAVESARAAFPVWRTMPAPKRGEVVRQIGEALRKYSMTWAVW